LFLLNEEIMNPLAYAKLSLQRALLGAVTPTLRAVSVDVDEKAKKLFISFFYDGEITDDIFDIASTAIAEVDVPGYYELDECFERLDFPEKIPVRGQLVYLRKE
jgi:hypothetical protein